MRAPRPLASLSSHPVEVPMAEGAPLDADLVVPAGARGVVVFAHGSGSSRHSSRNRRVAGELQRAGLATVLLDLLRPEEEAVDVRTRELRFDIDLLGARVGAACRWAAATAALAGFPLGLFGASTGAAAALVAAAEHPVLVGAVVSRGGRPDLAGAALERVAAPTLLLVGGADELVLGLNREALAHLAPPSRLDVVPGAGHLFEEPGAIDAVARDAAAWFTTHLGG